MNQWIPREKVSWARWEWSSTVIMGWVHTAQVGWGEGRMCWALQRNRNTKVCISSIHPSIYLEERGRERDFKESGPNDFGGWQSQICRAKLASWRFSEFSELMLWSWVQALTLTQSFYIWRQNLFWGLWETLSSKLPTQFLVVCWQSLAFLSL